MEEKSRLAAVSLTDKKNLLTLVENQQKYQLDSAQLNIFETHQQAEKVRLSFNDVVLTSMLRGKKVMHLQNKASFDYLPGESVIVPGDEVMEIDFPEANENNPTQCLALVISKDQISTTLDLLNNKFQKETTGESWNLQDAYFHIPNNFMLTDAINQLVKISLHDNTKEKGLLTQLKLEEVLIRLMQTQARLMLENEYKSMTNNPFATVVEFIKNNLNEELTVDMLCKKAYMSKATFYRKFSLEFGITPQAFVQRERIKKAKKLLEKVNVSVMEVAYLVGFNNAAHFSTFFKNITGTTPSQYQFRAVSNS